MIKVYLAGPVVAEKEITDGVDTVCAILRRWGSDVEVYRPCEHRVPNAWGISQESWAQCVFTMDVLAIDECDWVVACDFGRQHAAMGTAWECGYAFAKGKRILVVTMPGVDESSLMLEGCASCVWDIPGMRQCKEPSELFYERGREKNERKLT